uniref:Uncharacterized protein n=1 Tax=Lactuca sativa TaxID=4236 RepID=A0A9R1X0H6_LACSA|nr:hypothetical protein LSAT_V11C700386180 [Lactuca sativa]
MDSPSSPTTNTKTNSLDPPLHVIGFEITELTPHKVTDHLQVTKKSCQSFNVLHDGVSTFLAGSLASTVTFVASGYKKIVIVQLNFNHLKLNTFILI